MLPWLAASLQPIPTRHPYMLGGLQAIRLARFMLIILVVGSELHAGGGMRGFMLIILVQ